MKVGMRLRLGLAIAAVLLAGAAAGAQGPGGGREMGPGAGFGGDHRPPFEKAFGSQGRWWNNPKIAEKLKLTDAQRKSMDDILLSHRETLIDLKGSLEKAELMLEPLMKEDQPNEAKILAGIDKVASARAELEKANARFLLAIRGKLTPEQWKMVQDFRSHQGQEGRGMGRGEGHGGPGGPGGQGREGWKQGGQGPGGPGEQGGPGMQFRHRQPPPAGAAPAPGAAPATPGPQSMDDGGTGSDPAAPSPNGVQQ